MRLSVQTTTKADFGSFARGCRAQDGQGCAEEKRGKLQVAEKRERKTLHFAFSAFGFRFCLTERWLSGRKQRFAKAP